MSLRLPDSPSAAEFELHFRFRNPSLTYFEPDMVERIERLKREGVESVEESRNSEGKTDNAIAEAPDGQYFFLGEAGGSSRRFRPHGSK